EVPVIRNAEAAGVLEILAEFLEDVLQAGRRGDPSLHREAQSVRLPRPVIRILAEDYDLHRVERRAREGVEDERAGRVDRRAAALFLQQKLLEAREVVLSELLAELALPGLLDFRIDRRHGRRAGRVTSTAGRARSMR